MKMKMNIKKSIKSNPKNRIYLDFGASTPVDSRVVDLMSKVESTLFGNPVSLHIEGEYSKSLLEEARLKMARILECRTSEIFFTSGSTESLNIGIIGVVKAVGKGFDTPHIITSSIEHSAVLEPLKYLLKEGKIELSIINPKEDGILDPNTVIREIKENTVLIVLSHSNNEIGTIQPIHKISSFIKKNRLSKNIESLGNGYPYLLVDASPSPLYENVSPERLGADLLVLDGMKMYGPRSSGILFVKHWVSIQPITFGGGQENGLRPGTQSVASACGLALALDIAYKMQTKEKDRLSKIQQYSIKKILKEIPNTTLNGSLENRLPNNVNMCFENKDSEFLVIKLDTLGFAVSAASACTSLKLENSSSVIEALSPSNSSGQLKRNCASSSLRFTFGRETKKQDIDRLVSALKSILK